ncbi:MAG TPA: SusD/RagB family nutrient-binding outer membrane lipoprotein [Pedobacter sp.]
MKSTYQSVKFLGSLILGSSIVLGLGSCTKNFDKYNTDPAGISNENTQVATVFIPFQQQIMYSLDDGYQTGQNLNADVYAGYATPPQNFGAVLNNTNYSFVDGWNSEAFNPIYTELIGPIKNKLAATGVQTKLPDFWAVALIVEVEAMDRLTDKFGPAPYSKVGTTLTGTPYDSQQSIYQQMFLQLDTATNNLQSFIAANPGKTPFSGSDAIYGGDYTKWLKFANSLRLRLAMHLVKVDPTTAKIQGEKAMAAAGGLMTNPADNANLAVKGQNDYWQITDSYTDNSMNASIGSYMSGYKDPRLPVYFIPVNTDQSSTSGPLPVQYAGQYIGIRAGISTPNKPYYSGYSVYNYNTTFTVSAKETLMTAAEVYFLKAEAALRGWAGAGDAQSNYEAGISSSMDQYGVSKFAAAYIADGTSVPAAYVDPKNSNYNSAAPSTVGIKWNTGGDSEQKLEQIITQKWLAMFPEGQEAWTEFRRTGYPKLFPVINNNSGGTVDTKIQVRRLPYPVSEYSSNGTNVKAGVSLLGGPDNGGTRLWWDVNKGNF